MNRRLIALSVIAGLVVAGVIVGVLATTDTTARRPVVSATTTQNIQEKLDAQQRAIKKSCQDAVLDDLKAPATAQFSDVDATLSGNDEYSVTGAVDAENGFGALIRNSFACITKLSTGDTWESTATVY